MSFSGLDEPVRRYFRFSLGEGEGPEGAGFAEAYRLEMNGRIKVGPWLPFAAGQWLDGEQFEWTAKVPVRGLPLLEVTDRYRNGAGGTAGRVLGRFRAFADESPDAVRSAAMRAAMEGTLAPATLLPDRGVQWRAESDDSVVFSRPGSPEASEIRLRIDRAGRPREVSAMRWRTGDGEPRYQPFGCVFDSVTRFGSLTAPDRIHAGWGFGTPDFKPFFRATITELEPAGPNPL